MQNDELVDVEDVEDVEEDDGERVCIELAANNVQLRRTRELLRV